MICFHGIIYQKNDLIVKKFKSQLKLKMYLWHLAFITTN